MSLIIRCSQLGKIMTDGKKGEELSAGAKTYLRELLKKEILGYDDEISSKYLEKGIRCEQESLNLYRLRCLARRGHSGRAHRYHGAMRQQSPAQ